MRWKQSTQTQNKAIRETTFNELKSVRNRSRDFFFHNFIYWASWLTGSSPTITGIGSNQERRILSKRKQTCMRNFTICILYVLISLAREWQMANNDRYRGERTMESRIRNWKLERVEFNWNALWNGFNCDSLFKTSCRKYCSRSTWIQWFQVYLCVPVMMQHHPKSRWSFHWIKSLKQLKIWFNRKRTKPWKIMFRDYFVSKLTIVVFCKKSSLDDLVEIIIRQTFKSEETFRIIAGKTIAIWRLRECFDLWNVGENTFDCGWHFSQNDELRGNVMSRLTCDSVKMTSKRAQGKFRYNSWSIFKKFTWKSFRSNVT